MPGATQSRILPILVIAVLAGSCGSSGPDYRLASFSIDVPADDDWNVARSGGTAVVEGTVCVIDTGIDLNHPDLNVSREWSRSFVHTGPEKDDPRDYNGHGTHIAGIVAARDDDVGVTGIASGATVVGIKVVDKNGQGYTQDVLAGIRYASAIRDRAGDLVCDVVNLSMGAAADPAVDKAVWKASRRVPFVISAGNKGVHVSAYSPARLNAKRVYTVTAIARGDRWPLFSNYGPGIVDFAAPGVRVRSTWKNGGYKTISGTSAAAAHVTGMLLRGGPVPDTVVVDPRGDSYVIPVAPPPASEPLLASVGS